MSSNILDCLIIGAGPSGIAAAYEARKRGISSNRILILEKSDKIASNIRDKYPDEKMVLANYKGQVAQCMGDVCIHNMTKVEFLKYMDDILEKSQVSVHFNEIVKNITKLNNGQLQLETNQDSYLSTSIFVALGTMGTPRKLSIKYSKEVAPKIIYDLQDLDESDKHVLVIGGGDSASEFCQILSERGLKVELSYRKSDLLNMSEVNSIELLKRIKEGKVIFHPSTEVSSVEQIDSSLKIRLNNSLEVTADKIISALGFETPKNYLSSLNIGMSCEEGQIFCESSHQGLYFIGDLAQKKGGSINLAFNSAYNAINEACQSNLDCTSSVLRQEGKNAQK
jgi:thioredoxin reductase (NADPH)